mgnify:CR=1 FL=1
MSGVAALFNVPGNPAELAQWSAAHMSHHRDINRRIYELAGVSLPEFVLDPINPDDTGVWEDQHQQMHQEMDAALGINGFDLSNVNFENEAFLAGWIQLHFNEHYQAANILEIG